MTPEDLIKKLQDEAKRHPHGWPPRTEKEEAQFIAGGQFGYLLAQEEIERLKGLIEDAYIAGRNFKKDSASEVYWQDFKKENNL